MPRSSRTDVDMLRQEVRAMELLANEAEVPLDRMQAYWDLSAELINLSADVDEFGVGRPDADADEPEMLSLRRRVRDIASRLAELTLME